MASKRSGEAALRWVLVTISAMLKTPDPNEPEVVYHFTSMETMTKIVEHETIWATSINYLNDTSEGKHFGSLVRRRLPYYIQKHAVAGDDLALLLNYLQTAKPPFLESFAESPFVASFSRESDSLPQWRSYCPNGNGVAIGFRVECLHLAVPIWGSDTPPEHQLTRGVFDYVRYIENLTEDDIDVAITGAIRVAKNYAVDELDAPFRWAIDHAACFIKDSSFRAENEGRLLIHAPRAYHHYHFKATRTTLVPYIPVRIPKYARFTRSSEPGNSELTGIGTFISRVIVGPTPNLGLSQDSISALFQKYNLDVKVVPSQIPFRDC